MQDETVAERVNVGVKSPGGVKRGGGQVFSSGRDCGPDQQTGPSSVSTGPAQNMKRVKEGLEHSYRPNGRGLKA